MHDTAMKYGEAFFRTYLKGSKNLTIVDIGSQDINGSLRCVSPPDNTYVGVDFVTGRGVDLVIEDPYKLPFTSESIDVVVSSSCFEHSEFFWLLFNECLRILKAGGLFYVNAPSNGAFHRHPVDCWRFYPDSGIALQNWGRRSGFNCTLLESFIGMQEQHRWNDFVAVFVKDEVNTTYSSHRIQNEFTTFTNGRSCGTSEIRNYTKSSEDQIANKKLVASMKAIREILSNR